MSLWFLFWSCTKPVVRYVVIAEDARIYRVFGSLILHREYERHKQDEDKTS